VSEDNIIVMVQDDLANNYMNPHPGKVYNKPNGPDVYEGVPLVRLPWPSISHVQTVTSSCPSR
jgi:hypothetical protein